MIGYYWSFGREACFASSKQDLSWPGTATVESDGKKKNKKKKTGGGGGSYSAFFVCNQHRQNNLSKADILLGSIF